MSKKVLSLDSKSLYVSFKGEEYELTPLKLKHQTLADKLTSDDADEVLNSIYELLEESGMPKEVSENIAIDKVKDIIEALADMSQKKS